MKKFLFALIVFGLTLGGSVLASGGYTINTIFPSLAVSNSASATSTFSGPLAIDTDVFIVSSLLNKIGVNYTPVGASRTVTINNSATGASMPLMIRNGLTTSDGQEASIGFDMGIADAAYVSLNAIRTNKPLSGMSDLALRMFNGSIFPERFRFTASGQLGIGTSTPTTELQVTTTSNNATSTVTIGKANQTKGACLELFNSVGTATYCSVNGTTFSCSATSCK